MDLMMCLPDLGPFQESPATFGKESQRTGHLSPPMLSTFQSQVTPKGYTLA